MRHHADSAALARNLALAYTLLVIYASLHPFSGWHNSGAPIFDFLRAAWPRHWAGLDFWLNIVAYVPLGFLLTTLLCCRFKPGRAALIAWLAATTLSFGVETLQNFLPTRVSSNVDLVTNSLGAFIGIVAGLRWGSALILGGSIHRWRMRRLHRGTQADLGLVLLLLWLLTQLSPEILLFGTGDLRHFFDFTPGMAYTAERFLLVEALIAAAGTLGVGLFAWRLLREPSSWLLGALFVLALLVRTCTALLLTSPDDLLRWATPGNMRGLGGGLFLLWCAIRAPRLVQQALAALSLLLVTALVNLAPENPYLVHSLHVWRQGHFLNFNGLTRLTSSLWPYLALAFLVAIGPGRDVRHNEPMVRPL